MSEDAQSPDSSAEIPERIVVRRRGVVHELPYQQGETLLDTLDRARVPIATACCQGICGTCMVRRIRGEVRLRENHVLNDATLAAGYTLACQGEPSSAVCEIEILD